MSEPFIGSEAVAAAALTKSQLATRYRRLFPDVYVVRDGDVDARVRAKAGWLWTGRRGVVAGFAAAALHGSKWVDDVRVVEVIHDNRRSPPGIQTHRDRIEEDEIDLVAGIPVTSPVRLYYQECGRKPRDRHLTPTSHLYAKCDGRNLGDLGRNAVILGSKNSTKKASA